MARRVVAVCSTFLLAVKDVPSNVSAKLLPQLQLDCSHAATDCSVTSDIIIIVINSSSSKNRRSGLTTLFSVSLGQLPPHHLTAVHAHCGSKILWTPFCVIIFVRSYTFPLVPQQYIRRPNVYAR